MTGALVDHYGLWVIDWDWTRDNTGGPVGSWCCGSHSIGSPDETGAWIRDALLEWRGWLEELDAAFDSFGLQDGQ